MPGIIDLAFESVVGDVIEIVAENEPHAESKDQLGYRENQQV
jgi:hypothetical protein